jgi:hypothetical protein
MFTERHYSGNVTACQWALDFFFDRIAIVRLKVWTGVDRKGGGLGAPHSVWCFATVWRQDAAAGRSKPRPYKSVDCFEQVVVRVDGVYRSTIYLYDERRDQDGAVSGAGGIAAPDSAIFERRR